VLPRSASEAFPLFTPKGEEAWLPGWSPTYIRPESGEACEEMLFITGEGDEKTFWTCLLWQPEQWHVRYLRLTPASRVAFVDVQCTPDGPQRTRVGVACHVHAISDHGQAYLEGLTTRAFAKSIDEWTDIIQAMA